MDYECIKHATLSIYRDCQICSFPLNCFAILDNYKIKVHAYSSLSDTLRKHCLNYSDDALNYKGKLCYNDKMPDGRIRFSLMHELGHIILKHSGNHTPQMEHEANYFASNILAPRMAIHYAGCRNENDVSKLFSLTHEAAQYAFDDYKRWYRRTVYYKMNAFDKAIYAHFYNDEAKCFIYNIKKCAYCDREIYNSPDILCKKCNTPSRSYLQYHPLDEDLLIAQNQWLYRGL